MNEIVAIVEGHTELAFVRGLVASHLGKRGLAIWACLPGRVARRGGVRAWQAIRGDILRTLRERRGRVCTTMFDYYAMPDDWPGRDAASTMPLDAKGAAIEKALLADVAAHAGPDFRAELFIPYVQIHEFESLLFADPTRTAEVLAAATGGQSDRLAADLKSILDAAGQAEAIDDGYETCPSRRIATLVPTYRKLLHGLIIAERTGVEALRAACPHFGQWLARLESLGAG